MKKQLSGIEKAFRMVWDADKIYPFLLLLQALVVSASPLYNFHYPDSFPAVIRQSAAQGIGSLA